MAAERMGAAERLSVAAHDFATELSDTVALVAGGDCPRFIARPAALSAHIRQADGSGVPLARDGRTIIRLLVSMRVTLDHQQDFLRTIKSSFKVYAEGRQQPLYRYEYEDAKESSPLPAAHVQVHGRHEDLEAAMVEAERATTRSTSKTGTSPNITDLHLPVGGTRFRPCLEDVLEHLIVEFRISPVPGALAALEEGRRTWRERQLRATIRDRPDLAVDQLRRMGYAVRRKPWIKPPATRGDHSGRI